MSLIVTRRLSTAAALGAAAVLLTACASGAGSAPTSPPRASEPVSVQTAYPATVLDDGDGPELCLGAIMGSYPPQCGGPTLLGWDWDDWAGQYDEASGVRWAMFWVAGTYDADADTFQVAEAGPAAARTWPVYEDLADFTTPCAEPAGGWRVVDQSAANQEALDRTLAFAATMDGYAGAWLDQSINPTAEPDPGADDAAMIEYEESMNDPTLLILNVRTTGDIATAENALREHWGGMLCVSAAERTEAELLQIQDELNALDSRPLSSWTAVTTGVVHTSVIFDDGSLQDALDEKYGDGVVQVTSALVPWS